MKLSSLLLLFLIFYCKTYTQTIHENYTQINDSLKTGKGNKDYLRFGQKGYTLILPEQVKPVKGVIISLEEDKFDLNNPKQQISMQANAKGLAVLYLSTGVPVDLYFSQNSLHYIDTSLSSVFKKFQLPADNIFFLGVSLSGHRALRYMNYVNKGKSKFKPFVSGIVLCDGVLDWVRQWYEETKAVRDNFAASSVYEGKMITYLLEKNLKGNPKNNLQSYLDFSPYSYFDETNRNLKDLKGIAVRSYSEPANHYWMNEKRKTVFDTNFPDMVGIINELKLSGNERSELVLFHQDKTNPDRRNPYYTWGLVDKNELIDWMMTVITNKGNNKMATSAKPDLNFKSGYSEVNGLKMYYETYGNGKPIVLIHGGGSTIQTTFGKVIPLLAKNRKIIAVELQAHGRTSDRNADLSFEQDADDVAALLKNLHIDKADFFGFSNGGTTVLQIAIRHPEMVNKIVLGSALAKRSGSPEWFWDFMKQARLENMPEELKKAYQQVAAEPNSLQIMHDRDVKRMLNFKDIPDEKIKSIKAPALIIIGDKDMVRAEHALDMHKLITNSQLAIIPGGHGDYIGEITTLHPATKESEFVIPMIEKFLNQP